MPSGAWASSCRMNNKSYFNSNQKLNKMNQMTIKKMNVADAGGWYLAEVAVRKWTENFTDKDTGEVVPIERSEIISPVGDEITPITIAMLQANGVTEVVVSDKKIIGRQQKRMSLWQLDATYTNVLGKEVTSSYIIPKGSPLECEMFFHEWAMLNISGPFAIKKIVPLDYGAVHLPYQSEIDDAGKKDVRLRFYKAVVKSNDSGKFNIIVLSDRVRTVEAEVWAEYLNEGFYDRITEIKEIDVAELFEDGLNIARYSLAMHNLHIESAARHLLDKALADNDTSETETVEQ